MKKQFNSSAFTLIELLIVVAIIAILAAIAVPNFLEAQVRAKISRVKSEFRTVDLALNTYRVDNNKFPYPKGSWGSGKTQIQALTDLTTPIAYLASIDYPDPFQPKMVFHWAEINTLYLNYQYVCYEGFWADVCFVKDPATGKAKDPKSAFLLDSCGPDRIRSAPEYGFKQDISATDYIWGPFTVYGLNSLYDSTNGTMGGGDIVRFGGACEGAPNL